MSRPVIYLPSQLHGQSMAQVVTRLKNIQENTPSSEISFDFSTLNFIRPTGVSFFSNLIDWLNKNGTVVFFSGMDKDKPSIRYLDDSNFFKHYLSRPLNYSAKLRPTTIPLTKILHKDSHMWLRTDFVPWLSGRLDLPENSFHQFQTCVSELFNNINDHSSYDIGCIFAQHFPTEKHVLISVSDFGVGIPHSVKRIEPLLSDAEAIIRAFCF